MAKNLDLLLVNPGNRISQFGNVSEYATVAQPLGIAMLANFLREKGYSIDLFDAEVHNLGPREAVDEILKYNPRAVGLTAFTTKMTAAGKIMSILKEVSPDIITLVGGHHVSAVPRKTLEEESVDFVIQGEGYVPLLRLIKILKEGKNPRGFKIPGLHYHSEGFKKGSIISNPPEELIRKLEKLPSPAWDLLPMEKYKAHHWQTWGRGNQNSFGLVFSSLGCPFSCEFCSVNVVYGKRGSRFLTPEQFVEQIDNLVENYGTEHIEIIDDTFTLNTKRVIKISELIADRGYNINMWCFARTDRTDPEMLSKMKKAGINWVFMGLESGSDKTLLKNSKKQNQNQIRSAVKKIKDAGIYLGGNFIFGLPGDTHESMQETLDLALELNSEWANFFIPMAYPGTKIYEDALGKGILPRYWEQYGFFAPNAVPLPTSKLNSEEIITFRDKAFDTFFGSSNYQNMIEEKFGSEIKKYITQMLTKKLDRTPNPERELKYLL